MALTADQWQEISHSLKQSIIITDLHGKVLDFNPSWLNLGLLNGVPEDFEWYGLNLFQWVERHAANGNSFAEFGWPKLQTMLSGSDSFQPVQYHNHYSEEPQWLLLELSSWKSKSQQPCGFIVSISDLTPLYTEQPVHSPDSIPHHLLPMCAVCNRIRDHKDIWNTTESYLKQYFHIEFTHDICPDCMRRLYPQYSVILKDSMK